MRREIARTAIALAASALLGSAAVAWAPEEGGELVGRPAPELDGLTWLDQGPLTLEALRGKVVLLRFWTDGCPYCQASAPTLEALWREHRDEGLVVVGIHHPKSDASHDPAIVRAAARELGLTFPIATDPDWKTVGAYGVGTTFQKFTSVSFLVDAGGTIRFVHDGGEYHAGGGAGHEACVAADRALRRAVGELLREVDPAPGRP